MFTITITITITIEHLNNIFVRSAVSTFGDAQVHGYLNYHSFTAAICALAVLKYNHNDSNTNTFSSSNTTSHLQNATDSDRITTMSTASLTDMIQLECNTDKLVQLVRCYRQIAEEGVLIHLCIHQSSLFKMYQKSKTMYHNKKEIKSSYGMGNTIQKEEKKEVKINLFEYFCKSHDIIPSLCDTVLVLRISQYVKNLAKRDLLYFFGCLGFLIYSVARDSNDPFGSVADDISSTTSKIILDYILDSKHAHYS